MVLQAQCRQTYNLDPDLLLFHFQVLVYVHEVRIDSKQGICKVHLYGFHFEIKCLRTLEGNGLASTMSTNL